MEKVLFLKGGKIDTHCDYSKRKGLQGQIDVHQNSCKKIKVLKNGIIINTDRIVKIPKGDLIKIGSSKFIVVNEDIEQNG